MILVVDDDPEFLQEVQTALAQASKENVLMAGNAEEALGLIDSMGTTLSVILVDLDLPVMNGFDLISELRKKHPRLPVIAMSGVASEAVLEAAKLFGAADVLSKPITIEWKATVKRVREFHQNRN